MEEYIAHLQFRINMYRKLLELAKVPKLLIDNPEFIQNQPLKQEDVDLTNKWIEDYQNKQKDDLPW